MVITQLINATAIAASNGGVITPGVALTLQANVAKLWLEFMVVTTGRAVARPASESGQGQNPRKEFTLFAATSAQNITGGNLATATGQGGPLQQLLRHVAKPIMVKLSLDIMSEIAQSRLEIRGQYLYVWVEYPFSADAYTVSVTSTQIQYTGT